MEKDTIVKMNFFKKFYKSIFDFDFYKNFALEKFKETFMYVTNLIIIFAILATSIEMYALNKELKNGLKYINENVESIEFKNNLFSYNNNQYSIYDDEKNSIPIVIVDTADNVDLEKHKERVNLYDWGIILLKDRLYMHIKGEESMNSLTYAEINIPDMNKEEILNMFSGSDLMGVLFISMFFIHFISYLFEMLINSLMVALVGVIIGIILGLRIKFSEAYKMSFYALTLPTMLYVVYLFFSFVIRFEVLSFNWLYTTISYIYILVAILMIKADFINMQKQMIGLADEKVEKNENLFTNDEKNDTNDSDENKQDENKLDEQTES